MNKGGGDSNLLRYIINVSSNTFLWLLRDVNEIKMTEFVFQVVAYLLVGAVCFQQVLLGTLGTSTIKLKK